MSKDFEKYLDKLSREKRELLRMINRKIKKLDLKELDVKKLKGSDDLYRVRVGKWRIIFRKLEDRGDILRLNTRGDVY